MRALRLLLLVAYITYLVHVGLVMMLLPWSEVWSILLHRVPPLAAMILDSPAVRGALSAFGLLHLLLVVLEFELPKSRRLTIGGRDRAAADEASTRSRS